MISRGHGAVLIVGSTVVSAPSYAGAAYRASKAGLRSYMETLAVELAPFGIRVNMLAPGAFPTRLGDDLPEDQRVAGDTRTADSHPGACQTHGTSRSGMAVGTYTVTITGRLLTQAISFQVKNDN
jgi:NAD(P)-dependent dehydrogenase (short-subunit alcohol dehydrogenase family)